MEDWLLKNLAEFFGRFVGILLFKSGSHIIFLNYISSTNTKLPVNIYSFDLFINY